MYISYKQILKQAWQITIHNKILWLFGIFASFLALENVYSLILGQLSSASDPLNFYQSISDLYQKQSAYITNSLAALNLFKFDTTGFILLAIVGAAIIFCIWLALTSQIFVIKSADLIYHRRKMPTNLIFAQSSESFWQVLSLNILAKLSLYAGFIILALPLVYFILIRQFSLLIYANICFFLLYIIFAVIITFLVAYATNYIVLKKMTSLEAIIAAWKLFKRNITISLEISAIFFILKLVSIILILSLFLLFLLPLGMMLVLSTLHGDLIAVVLCLIILVLAFTAISLFINALFTAFYLSAWTITFIKLNEETLFGKILAWANNLPAYLGSIAKKNKINLDQNKMKTQAKKLAKEAESQAIILSAKVADEYKKYKPIVKKQSKILAKKAKVAYAKYQPIIKAETIKLSKDINKTYAKYEPILEREAKKIVKQAGKNWVQTAKKTSKKSQPSKTKQTKRRN